MIAVSSMRPFSDPESEYGKNQRVAHASWSAVFKAVAYFNTDIQPEMCNSITRFLPAENYPRIIDMVEFCMEQPDWCCILNADIVILPKFKSVEMKLKARKACAASSWRFEFDPARGFSPNERVDNGLDFFAATPDIWAKVYRDIPETLRMATQQWDSWMLAYFGMHATSGFYDITPSRTVLHPKHGGRQYGPYGGPVHFHGWPVMSGATID